MSVKRHECQCVCDLSAHVCRRVYCIRGYDAHLIDPAVRLQGARDKSSHILHSSEGAVHTVIRAVRVKLALLLAVGTSCRQTSGNRGTLPEVSNEVKMYFLCASTVTALMASAGAQMTCGRTRGKRQSVRGQRSVASRSAA